jgi:arginyl-tRNA synthetase
MNLLHDIHNSLQATIKALFPTSASAVELLLNTEAHKQQFGDLTSNCALLIAHEQALKPRDVAQKIQEHFQHEAIGSFQIAGPGFINLSLSAQAYHLLAQELYQQGDLFFKHEQAPTLSYCIEFVSANPTGPLHIGHGRGGIIGDVLSRILSFLGHRVTKEFYINDAGAQMLKLGASFKIRCQQAVGIEVQLPEDAYHGEYLVELAQECIKTYGAEVLKKPDEFFISYAKEELLARLKHTLSTYNISYDVWFSEKTLHDSGAIEKVIDQLKKKELLYDKDEALWFKSTAFGDDKDRVIKKQTGELTYVAADIAYLENKIERSHDHLIMVLGQDHHSYVQRLKGIMQALGYDPKRLDIILYQLVTIKEGGQALRLSKRAGRIITLDDVIELVGPDVARFFYLHKKADAHLDFDLELALKKTDENPVYYVQYAYQQSSTGIRRNTRGRAPSYGRGRASSS